MILAQLGLEVNPFAVLLGIVLVLASLAATVTNVVVLFVIARRRSAGTVLFAVGAATSFLFAALLLQRLSGRAFAPTFILALYFVASASGTLVMLMSLAMSFRGMRAVIAMLAVPVTVLALRAWIDMERRESLRMAVLRGNTSEARALLARGVAQHKGDEPFRQRLLVDSARDVNVGLVAALLAAGADPNVADDCPRTPLIAAMTADPVLRLNAIDPQAHRRNQLLTTKLLLDHGADPNAPVKPGEATPVEIAWGAGDREMLEMLEQKGAKNVRKVADDFDALMHAATEGDAERTNEILTSYGSRLYADTINRQPLMAAAAAGHLSVVEVLLKHYGGRVKCDDIWRAMDTAGKGNYPDVVARLRRLC